MVVLARCFESTLPAFGSMGDLFGFLPRMPFAATFIRPAAPIFVASALTTFLRATHYVSLKRCIGRSPVSDSQAAGTGSVYPCVCAAAALDFGDALVDCVGIEPTTSTLRRSTAPLAVQPIQRSIRESSPARLLTMEEYHPNTYGPCNRFARCSLALCRALRDLFFFLPARREFRLWYPIVGITGLEPVTFTLSR